MATTFKTLSANDIVSTKSLLHEAIPITGTIVSGTYNDGSSPPVPLNVKNYTHGMFQSVYDYPYLSSSANHIFDVSMGISSDSALSGSSGNHKQIAKKINVYNQMAQVLVGYDSSGNIRKFDSDGDLVGTTTDKMNEVFFINFSRLLSKDEIKKGSFSIELGVNSVFDYGANTAFTKTIKIRDEAAATDYRVNSPAGDYGVLYATSSTIVGSNPNLNGETLGAAHNASTAPKAGLVYYQAGIAVISASVFLDSTDDGSPGTVTGILHTSNAGDTLIAHRGGGSVTGDTEVHQLFVSGAMSASCDALRHRLRNIEFNNTTELNSTVYFCRAHHNEFNYSTNPTYLNASQLRVKNVASDSPVSYVTTVGLYSADNELLATAKLSEPLKKDPTNELTLRVRLDY